MPEVADSYPNSFWQYGNVFDDETSEPLPWATDFLAR
jgi:hypothetical protein